MLDSRTPGARVARLRQSRLWRMLGPGLVTGAADDDPSGIATYAQAAQEVEDTKAHPSSEPLLKEPKAPEAIARIRADTLIGMAFSNLVGIAILVTSAVTLHSQGVKDVGTAAAAAEALRPVAGPWASALFALGVVGTGLLSVPVLAGSAAYALGEARRWPVGLSKAGAAGWLEPDHGCSRPSWMWANTGPRATVIALGASRRP